VFLWLELKLAVLRLRQLTKPAVALISTLKSVLKVVATATPVVLLLVKRVVSVLADTALLVVALADAAKPLRTKQALLLK
jgi:hypothetical protein